MNKQIQEMGKTAGNLIIMEAEKKHPQRLPSRDQIQEAINDLGFSRPTHVMTVKVDMMGSSEEPLYFALGGITFALIENYDNNPDGCNRFHMPLPLAVKHNDRYSFPGHDDIDPEVINEATADLIKVMRNFTDPRQRFSW